MAPLCLVDCGRPPRAAVTPGESVEGMRAVIERVTPNDSGRFFNFDGHEIQW